ncbi:hypothetical protein TI05_02550 [Achromatium sp. WMS3]|nr:hypothetical protein TI05_02550 [Achromatium sp. WMS3]
MPRLYNFSAGPATAPEEVLQQASAEMLNWHDTGMSVLEMSHRGKDFMSIAQQAETDLRELLTIPDNYKVLFLQGGATSQFAMVPLNLMGTKAQAEYIITGSWSKKAFTEGKRLCNAHLAATTETSNFTQVPDPNSLQFAPDTAYVHYTPNETIHGVEFPYIPDTGNIPLVADMSSTILSRPIDVSRFGIIYAGTQKNMGPAGMAVVIIRDDLLGQTTDKTPAMFNYKNHADAASMFNTPPTYSWYMAGLVFQWLKRQGGLEAMATINQRKAEALYTAIDNSGFYKNPVDPNCRSWMNVPFVLPDPALDKPFLEEATKAGLVALKGHRSVGGMRASIYNAMPEQGVQALIAFMAEFQRSHG